MGSIAFASRAFPLRLHPENSHLWLSYQQDQPTHLWFRRRAPKPDSILTDPGLSERPLYGYTHLYLPAHEPLNLNLFPQHISLIQHLIASATHINSAPHLASNTLATQVLHDNEQLWLHPHFADFLAYRPTTADILTLYELISILIFPNPPSSPPFNILPPAPATHLHNLQSLLRATLPWYAIRSLTEYTRCKLANREAYRLTLTGKKHMKHRLMALPRPTTAEGVERYGMFFQAYRALKRHLGVYEEEWERDVMAAAHALLNADRVLEWMVGFVEGEVGRWRRVGLERVRRQIGRWEGGENDDEEGEDEGEAWGHGQGEILEDGEAVKYEEEEEIMQGDAEDGMDEVMTDEDGGGIEDCGVMEQGDEGVLFAGARGGCGVGNDVVRAYEGDVMMVEGDDEL